MNTRIFVSAAVPLLRREAERHGPIFLDHLQHPMTQLWVDVEGQCHLTAEGAPADCVAYGSTAGLSATARLEAVISMSAQDAADAAQGAARAIGAFAVNAPLFMDQIAVELYARLTWLEAPEDGPYSAPEHAADHADAGDDDRELVLPHRAGPLVWLMWATVLVLAHAAWLFAGLIAAAVVGGGLAFAMAKRWGKSVPSAALWPILLVVLLAGMVVVAALQKVARDDRSDAIAQRSGPAGSLPEQGAVSLPAPAPAPAAPLATDWDTVASAFEQAHPELKLDQNESIMQSQLDQLATPTMDSGTLLRAAYDQAQHDPRWTWPRAAPPPQPPPGFTIQKAE